MGQALMDLIEVSRSWNPLQKWTTAEIKTIFNGFRIPNGHMLNGFELVTGDWIDSNQIDYLRVLSNLFTFLTICSVESSPAQHWISWFVNAKCVNIISIVDSFSRAKHSVWHKTMLFLLIQRLWMPSTIHSFARGVQSSDEACTIHKDYDTHSNRRSFLPPHFYQLRNFNEFLMWFLSKRNKNENRNGKKEKKI